MNRAIERHETPWNAPETAVQMWSGEAGGGRGGYGIGAWGGCSWGKCVGRLVQCESGMLHM